MRAWRKRSRRSGGDRAEAEELPIWTPRPRHRVRRMIPVAVAVVLIGFGALIPLGSEEPIEPGLSCGDALSISWVFGDAGTAAPGDVEACRASARQTLAVATLM